MLDFRIYTFLEVCKTLNYTRAAQNLNITQPAVSQHIRYLETYYGFQLFRTGGKKIYLTKTGEILRQSLSAMVHDEVYLRQRLEESGHQKKVVAFGVTRTVGEFNYRNLVFCLSKMKRRIHINYPEVKVSIRLFCF